MTLVLDKLFKGEGVSYTIEKRQIVLNKSFHLNHRITNSRSK